jgi:uncharacterized protein YegL
MSTNRLHSSRVARIRSQCARILGGGILLGLMIAAPACDGRSEQTAGPKPAGGFSPNTRSQRGYGAEHQIPLPRADQRLCTAVVILLDTSGSMGESVRGSDGARQPKHQIARAALERIVEYTREWRDKHPDRAIQLGILNFSSSARPVLPMAAFDAKAAQDALASIPAPGGGTAIGDAMTKGFQALYASGCVRKYLVCITDGQNTSGPRPERVARQLYDQTRGEVELHFVAFDTSADYFDFLKDVNGYTVQADDGAQLADKLAEIYEKRILAEAMPAEKE